MTVIDLVGYRKTARQTSYRPYPAQLPIDGSRPSVTGSPNRMNDTAFRRVITEFLSGHQRHTRNAYRRDLRDYLAFCAHRHLDVMGARRSDIRSYLDHLEGMGRSSATLARRLVTLRGFYETAVDEGILESSPVARIRSRRPRPQTRVRSLTRHELDRFLISAEHQDDRTKALAWLLAATGLRISEACNARIEHLHHQSGETWLDVRCKGERLRSITIHPQLWAHLIPAIDGRQSGPIFSTRNGQTLDRANAARTLNAVARAADIEGPFSPHVLRHTFVTLARQAGCTLEDVQDAVGHADPATTRRYDRTVLPATAHPAYKILPPPLSPAGEPS
jgi:integrase/recombinase XerD